MNGAITDPCVKIISAPIKTRVKIKGASQYFFLILKKSHTSLINSNNSLNQLQKFKFNHNTINVLKIQINKKSKLGFNFFNLHNCKLNN